MNKKIYGEHSGFVMNIFNYIIYFGGIMIKIQDYIIKLHHKISFWVNILFDTSGYSMWKKNKDGKWIYNNND